ncbi:hypothetical protein EV363DRAFT_1178801, partial [Boletus edulis]
KVMIYSLDKDTRSNYGSEDGCMPASLELIAAFATSHVGRISDKTLNNWLAGLHFWHTVNGATWHGSNMLKSVRRELLPHSTTDFSSLKHVTCSILPFKAEHLPNHTAYLSFHIPWTKTTREAGAKISITAHPHCMDPLTALITHEHVNHDIPPHASLFAYHTNSGWSPLTKNEFIS